MCSTLLLTTWLLGQSNDRIKGISRRSPHFPWLPHAQLSLYFDGMHVPSGLFFPNASARYFFVWSGIVILSFFSASLCINLDQVNVIIPTSAIHSSRLENTRSVFIGLFITRATRTHFIFAPYLFFHSARHSRSDCQELRATPCPFLSTPSPERTLELY